MIPWFVVNIISTFAAMFGRDTYVRAWSGKRWGAERIYLQPRLPGAPRPRRLKPYRGGPLSAAV